MQVKKDKLGDKNGGFCANLPFSTQGHITVRKTAKGKSFPQNGGKLGGKCG